MTSISIENPSAWHAIRVASQNRVRNSFEKAPPAAPSPKRETGEALEKRGAVITMKKMRVSTKFSSEMRECPVPLWQAEGADLSASA